MHLGGSQDQEDAEPVNIQDESSVCATNLNRFSYLYLLIYEYSCKYLLLFSYHKVIMPRAPKWLAALLE